MYSLWVTHSHCLQNGMPSEEQMKKFFEELQKGAGGEAGAELGGDQMGKLFEELGKSLGPLSCIHSVTLLILLCPFLKFFFLFEGDGMEGGMGEGMAGMEDFFMKIAKGMMSKDVLEEPMNDLSKSVLSLPFIFFFFLLLPCPTFSICFLPLLLPPSNLSFPFWLSSV